MSAKRRYKRIGAKHKAYLMQLVEEFHTDVINSGHDAKSHGYASAFKTFNQKWITYCRQHKVANEEAFKILIENCQ